jgi:hypothetical protein
VEVTKTFFFQLWDKNLHLLQVSVEVAADAVVVVDSVVVAAVDEAVLAEEVVAVAPAVAVEVIYSHL